MQCCACNSCTRIQCGCQSEARCNTSATTTGSFVGDKECTKYILMEISRETDLLGRHSSWRFCSRDSWGWRECVCLKLHFHWLGGHLSKLSMPVSLTRVFCSNWRGSTLAVLRLNAGSTPRHFFTGFACLGMQQIKKVNNVGLRCK